MRHKTPRTTVKVEIAENAVTLEAALEKIAAVIAQGMLREEQQRKTEKT